MLADGEFVLSRQEQSCVLGVTMPMWVSLMVSCAKKGGLRRRRLASCLWLLFFFLQALPDCVQQYLYTVVVFSNLTYGRFDSRASTKTL